MKVKKSDIKLWVAALRSGEYKQTRHDLQNDRGFCCLGVACDLFIPKKALMLDDDGFIMGGNPDRQTFAPVWLKKVDEHFQNRAGVFPQELNDNYDYSFDEIADLLEAVYIHEVLS